MILSYKSFNFRRLFHWALGSGKEAHAPNAPPPIGYAPVATRHEGIGDQPSYQA